MPPEVYFRPEQPGGLQLANTKEKGVLIPSVVVGAEMLQGRSEKELAFPIADFMTKLRPEHYLQAAPSPTNTELGIAFLAAIKLVQPNFPVPPNQAATVEQYLASHAHHRAAARRRAAGPRGARLHPEEGRHRSCSGGRRRSI